MSSIAPTDSVSSSGKRSKPGKRERQQARSAVGSAGGKPASASKAAAFAQGGSSDPVPMPGKYPVVFSTGAGEPTRDQEFALPVHKAFPLFGSVSDKYRRNPRYAEFRAHSEFTDGVFGTHLAVSSLLRLAQQLVHAHVNMGLPLGDFAPLASSDVRIPSALASVVNQFGEFSSPSIGTRFLLRDYEHAVSRVVFLADQLWTNGNSHHIFARSWLPMSNNDGNFKTIVASRLLEFISAGDLSILPTVLEDAVLSGEVPEAWEQVKDLLGDAPGVGQVDRRDRFDFLFKSYADVGQFTTAFTTQAASDVLTELGLPWNSPSAGHLNWQYSTKQRFTFLADTWAKLSAAYSQFFELSSGLATRQSATGSHAQMVDLTSVEGVTVLKAALALSAPEFSLAACFPPSCIFVGGITRRVVVTTSLSVSQRATEFCQMDWR
ncbi:capsid protein [Penicillium stoloniferum virus S]|uniref:Capsid protein n=1 Tax=Penicillium stoloniferum virus S TaxID=216371 RepID=Q6YDQ6_9VIRU|nr:capsid protein [Penicillium stoloniferum virus S]AAN86835.1 capsid protein [Penicillium stoloniferum virus S]AYP71822.1 capsid protein [Penicillium stoloniferum virus S]